MRSLHPRHRALVTYVCLNSNKISPIQAQIKHGHPFNIRKFSTSFEPNLRTSNDTIYALSTAPGRGAIAIIRASGPHCTSIFKNLCPNSSLLRPRQATVHKLYDPHDQRTVVDSAAVILHYPGPKSATGEDVLELHIHGGIATQRAVLAAISEIASITKFPIRYAEPGEFTKRAFLNHKLELAQVEALSDEISAETELQRQAAVRGDPRKLSKTYDRWREKLLLARAEIEALIDFSEDHHFEESPKMLLEAVTCHVNLILREIEKFKLASYRQELIKRGIKISLLGPPNSGKSSLLNRITGREVSIVSQEAGTTRDVIEVGLDIKGYLCTFADTAGLRNENTSDEAVDTLIGAIELEGIKRAMNMAEKSDIVILLASFEHENSSEICSIKYDHLSLSLAVKAPNFLVVVNKRDKVASSRQLKSLIDDFQENIATAWYPKTPPCIIPICCHSTSREADTEENNDDIQVLISKLLGIIETITEIPIDLGDLVGVSERQRLILDSFGSHLQDFKEEADIVLAAEHLRLAAGCMSRITGRGGEGDVEEVLGVIFEKY